MLVRTFIERVRRLYYDGIIPDDAQVTSGMVASLLPDAIANAVKENWIENIKMDGCACVNNSFYTTFSNIPITIDAEFGIYNAALPSLPTALGKNEGINLAYVYDDKQNRSKAVIMLSSNQTAYIDDLPKMNGIFGWNEGVIFKFKSDYPLLNCTAKIRMVSVVNTDLNSELNVPAEFFEGMTVYILKMLGVAQEKKTDIVSDGV